MIDASPAPDRQTIQCFWHGSQLGPYQLLCLRSFVHRGHRIELFTYDSALTAPGWITHRDANEILPVTHVLHYQSGYGKGSPALHSNLFRFAMLHELGGWWIDLDVVLLRDELPKGDFFFARAGKTDPLINSAVIKLPARHPLLVEAVTCCQAVGEGASWGQTGPILLTELVARHGLAPFSQHWSAAHPLPWSDVLALFDPAQCERVLEACSGSSFLHFFNEVWRSAGIPSELGPPQGSFLDLLFSKYDFGMRFKQRMSVGNVTRWITNRNERIRLERERDALLASTSWRLTAPLRYLADKLRNLVVHSDSSKEKQRHDQLSEARS